MTRHRLAHEHDARAAADVGVRDIASADDRDPERAQHAGRGDDGLHLRLFRGFRRRAPLDRDRPVVAVAVHRQHAADARTPDCGHLANAFENLRIEADLPLGPVVLLS